MKIGMTFLAAALMGLFMLGGEAHAQSLRDVATAAALVDRSDADAVREVQIGLRDLGFYTGPIDGIFGQMTYTAAVAAVEAVNAEVAAIQQDQGQILTTTIRILDDGSSDRETSSFDLAQGSSDPTPELDAAPPSDATASASASEVSQPGATPPSDATASASASEGPQSGATPPSGATASASASDDLAVTAAVIGSGEISSVAD